MEIKSDRERELFNALVTLNQQALRYRQAKIEADAWRDRYTKLKESMTLTNSFDNWWEKHEYLEKPFGFFDDMLLFLRRIIWFIVFLFRYSFATIFHTNKDTTISVRKEWGKCILRIKVRNAKGYILSDGYITMQDIIRWR